MRASLNTQHGKAGTEFIICMSSLKLDNRLLELLPDWMSLDFF